MGRQQRLPTLRPELPRGGLVADVPIADERYNMIKPCLTPSVTAFVRLEAFSF